MSYFSIERNGQCWMPVTLANKNGDPIFQEFLDMSYAEMKESFVLGDFVVAAMDAADSACNVDNDQTAVTLIGDDGNFVWGIIMSSENENDIRYLLVDYKKDGRSYRYAP